MMLAALLSCTAQALSRCKPYLVPDAIMSTVSAAPGLSAVLHLNPGYLRGDFDGWEVIDTQERAYSALGDFWPNKLADSVLLIWEDRGGGFLYRSAGSWHWDDGIGEP